MKTKQIESASYEEFFEALKEMRGIQELNLHLIRLLDKMNGGIEDATKKFLCLAFSLFDDGNTRVALAPVEFMKWWGKKWNGLVQLQKSLAEANGDSSESLSDEANTEDFKQVVECGINNILGNKLSKVVGVADSAKKDDEISLPLLIEKDKTPYLYLDKYYWAKIDIEDSMKKLFGNKFNDITIKPPLFLPDDGKPEDKRNMEQKEAVTRGLSENLIITGGPGTGKTTVVLYILWNLLNQNEELLNYDIYLAAPSGKAADRMRESLAGNLGKMADRPDVHSSKNYQKIFDKLNNLESSTIHRLLKFSRSKSDFSYNKENQFSPKSIFVIDEASMIDINLFASLLQAIPVGARLFILGDPYQLPSVDAGAVLGELLNAKSNENFRVKLIKSHRFDEKSEIGKLAKEINNIAEEAMKNDKVVFLPKELLEKARSFSLHPALIEKTSEEKTEEAAPPKNETPKDCVSYYQIEDESDEDGKKTQDKDGKPISAKENARIEFVLKEWLLQKEFIAIKKEGEKEANGEYLSLYDLPKLANEIKCENSTDTEETKRRDKIWNLSLSRRILSAERRGFRGVEWLNKKVCDLIKDGYKEDKQEKLVKGSGYFPGQLLMITKNQEMFKLYNGDTGIVVFDENTPNLMLKKAPTQSTAEGASKTPTRDDYVFYPLALLPADALETAFAITIHKSQGSEYDHVTVFLPKQEGHPLLNNQILYTGITRAKKSVEIIATPETFKAACETVIERDTGIEL
ncbi:MAG: AAA family ATPase [Fibrobacter sp.]|nr:AAA family ATPase [Fibrobacter sp.]